MADVFAVGNIKPCKMEDWVLLVIVIIIIYLYASGAYKRFFDASESTPTAPIAITAPVAPEVTAPAGDAGTTSTEDSKKEGLETRLINEGIIATNCEPDTCMGDLSFAKHDYGLPGIEFSEWAMYQTLDPRIVASNKQFVADRLGNPQTWTGATYSPDRHDTYDAVPWRGLYRPARVAVHSPDQIPDLDTSRYPVAKKFRWNSAEVE